MPASSPDPTPRRASRFGLSTRAWIAIGIAFVAGLLLFLLIWAKQRGDNDFFRAPGTTQSTDGRDFEPLPVPDTAGADPASQPPAPAGGAANEVAPEDDAVADVQQDTPVASLPPLDPSLPPPQADAGANAAATSPVPISNPPPRYPPAALRRGESGEAILRIHVLPDGSAGQIDLVRSSGSRTLDRAATDAVRKWRFQPALRAGQPVEGSVQIPIAFTAPR